jgi:Uma2 family endonuclease
LLRLFCTGLPSKQLNDDDFFEFCQANQEIHIEKTSQGDYEIMVPTGWETGRENLSLAAQLYVWAEQDGTGCASDSSTGFILPNGAIRSPDAAWVKKSRLAVLTVAQRKKFLPLCPDFVIELRSESDDLAALQCKMQEYQDNGAALGWLIDPVQRQVWVYQAHEAVLCLDNPEFLVSDDVLKGFRLSLQKVWDVDF